MIKFIDQIELSGKKVFIRADLNAPLTELFTIADDTRLIASIPTIKYALEHGGRVVLASHFGRPKRKEEEYSLKPVAKRLGELMKRDIPMLSDCIGPEVEAAVNALKNGELLMLENVRYYQEEEANDEWFSKSLARLADVYINDAFATAHRAHSSTVGMVKFVGVAAGGFTLKSELDYFAKAFEKPERPLLAIFGGSKVSTKIKAIRTVAERADSVVVGGAMANTFFAADGLSVGSSLCEKGELETARSTKAWFKEKGKKLLLPVDVVVAKEFKEGAESMVVDIDKIPDGYMALDIGPKSSALFAEEIKKAKTIIWNGPVGAFETEGFNSGTYALIEALSAADGLTVCGGGDTDLALHNCHAVEKMDYVSTAGGAFLTLLEGEKLPAVEALKS